MRLTRRAMLALTGSAAVIAALPVAPMIASDVIAAPAAPLLPAWAVGHGGEWDWQAIAAPTEEAARRIYIAEFTDFTACGSADKPCAEPCDFCEAVSALDTDRKPTWDGRVGQLTGADWLRADMGVNCSRCSYETDLPSGMGHIVGDLAICDDCMTLADWRIADPQYAAELEAELADEEPTDG